jgi:hypothetical protein
VKTIKKNKVGGKDEAVFTTRTCKEEKTWATREVK